MSKMERYATGRGSRLALAFGLALGLMATASTSRAGIFFIPPFPGGGGSLYLSDDLVFSINLGGAAQDLVFDDWVGSYDGTVTTVTATTSVPFSLNGGATSNGSMNATLTDNGIVMGDITDRDGLLRIEQNLGQIAVQSGNTFTIKASSYYFPAQVFYFNGVTRGIAGNVFIADQNGVRISNIIQAPEPSSTLLMLGAGASFLGWFRRRK